MKFGVFVSILLVHVAHTAPGLLNEDKDQSKPEPLPNREADLQVQEEKLYDAVPLPKLEPTDLPVADTESIDEEEYIVVFNEDASTQDIEMHKNMLAVMDTDTKISREYDIGGHFRGYAINASAQTAKEISSLPSVKYIEKKKIGRIAKCYVQSQANWGLVRSSVRVYGPSVTTYYLENFGANVRVYVIDTGIDITHYDFGGRAVWGYDTIDGPPKTDLHGHGTHVAGIIMGWTHGIAKKARAVAVRVCDATGDCPTSGVIDGINWAAEQHQPGAKSIINLSLRVYGGSNALDDAARAAFKQGIHVVVASGNDGVDACGISPARIEESITVGASDQNNVLAYFSNFGTCVDILAPGVDIKSDVPGNQNELKSGTSMAAPHVAGAIANLIENEPTNTSPTEMKQQLLKMATRGQILGISGNRKATPNTLLYIPACLKY